MKSARDCDLVLKKGNEQIGILLRNIISSISAISKQYFTVLDIQLYVAAISLMHPPCGQGHMTTLKTCKQIQVCSKHITIKQEHILQRWFHWFLGKKIKEN